MVCKLNCKASVTHKNNVTSLNSKSINLMYRNCVQYQVEYMSLTKVDDLSRALTLHWPRFHDLVHDVLLGAQAVGGAGAVHVDARG